MQDSEKQTQQLQRELREVDKLLKFNPDNVDLIRQKQELLTKAIDETSKKLNILKDAEKDVIAQFERGDIGEEQLRAFQREIIQTDSKLTNLRAKLEQVNSTLEDTDKTTTDTRNSFEKLKDTISEQESELSSLRKEYSNIVLEQGESSQEAQDLAKRILSLNDELQDNKRKLNDAEQAANDLGNEYKEAGDSAKTAEGGFTILKGALANLASNAIQGAISKIQEFVQGLFELSEATEEYRLMQAKLSGSAQTFGYDIDFIKEKYKEFYSYLSDDQMATNAITNLEGMGVSTETVSKSAEAAIAVWTAYGDSIPIESLTESINESSQVAKVTGVLADALNWAGISEDDFNAKLETCNSTQERADLIAQTLNDRYGESKARFDEMSGSILDSNKAQLELKDTQAQLGQALEPVNTALTEMKNDSLGKLVPIVETCADAFLKFKNWLDEGGAAATIAQAALVGLGTAAGVAATAFGGMLIIKTVTAAINAAKVAMAALNITMSLNPIGLVVAAIAGLVAAFVTLWNKSEEFRDFWTGLWETIKTAAGNVLDAIVNFFTQTVPEAFNSFVETCKNLGQSIADFFTSLPENIMNGLSALWESVSQWATNLGNTIGGFFTSLPERISTAFSNVVTSISEWATNMINTVITTVPQIVDSIVSFFSDLPYKIGYALGYVLGTIVKWITDCINTVITNFPLFVSSIVNFFTQLGTDIWNALTTAYNNVVQWVSNMIAKAVEVGSQFLQNVVSFFTQLPSQIWAFLQTAWTNVSTWVSQMVQKAVEVGSQFLQNVVSFFTQLPAQVWSFLQTTISNVANFVQQMIQNAIQAGSQFVQNVISFIQNLPQNVWNFLQSTISNAQNFVTQFMTKAKEAGTQFLNNVVSFIQQLPSKVWGFLTDAISKAGQFAGQMGAKAREAGTQFLNNIVSTLSSIPSRVVSIGADIVRGIWNGIQSMVGWIGQQISGFVSGILGGFKSALGIASPSKVMRDQIGKWIPAGVAEGIVENEDEPVQAFDDMQRKLLDTAVDVNGLNFNSQLDSTFGGSNASLATMITSVYGLLLNYLPKLLDKQQEIYLDSGELVGATINKIDIGMGNLNALKSRGV